MLTQTRNWLLAGLVGLLVACGGGGGGNSASGVEAGPPPPGGSVPPPPPNPPAPFAPYADAEELRAFITKVTIPDDGQPVVDWQLADGNGTAITDLTKNDVRFTIAKLQSSLLGNFTGTWQSYINRVSEPDPDDGDGTEPRLQATYEGVRNTDDGEFTNNGDGTYQYRMALNVNDLDSDSLEQAEIEGLDLSYDSSLVHRLGMQFDNAMDGIYVNPTHDFVPASGVTEGLMSMDIAATDNCNRCHDPLRIHGRRVEVKYCVTCHNPGSTDPSSTNTVDMKVMVHKIHMGANLPSVQDGGEYIVGGHDYSNLHYPQDIRNCVNCHVGTGTVGDRTDLVVTSQGDNWVEVATMAACGSCHDDVDFSTHQNGQEDDSQCSQCHAPGKKYGPENAHRILTAEAGERFAAEILMITDTMPGEFPKVQYRIVDPTNGNAPYDLQNDEEWTAGGGASRLAIDLAWDTTDYTNTGNGEDEDEASAVSLNALQGTPNGDGSYTIESEVAIPDGSLAPGIAATGSGIVAVEGHPAVDVGSEGEPDVQRIPFTNAHEFFSIDEADGDPEPRRVVVELEGCLSCHSQLSLHGSNRTDNLEVCAACHNPRNTDRQVREIASSPPTDGKDEESIDFKTMVHAIHAAGIRENPLQVVGFGGFTTYVYDEEAVHYPGNLANCTTCHTEEGFQLPLAPGVLATTTDTGADQKDPTDDTVTTPIAAVCSSCHDYAEDISHMEFYDGNFSTTQKAIDDRIVVEQCNTCHDAGKPNDAWEVHQRFLD